MHHFAKVCQQGKKPSNVNMLDHDSSSDESVFIVEHTVGTVKAIGEKWYATFHLSIGGETPRSVSCQMDSNSTCNLISHAEYCRIAQDGDPTLQKSDAKLRVYDGSVMFPLGTCKLHCRRQGTDYMLDFQVVVDQKPLLSSTTCEQR